MSKASQWAKLADRLSQARQAQEREWNDNQPKFSISTGRDRITPAKVTDTGHLRLFDTGNLTAESAIALARWLLDTFGEPQP